MDLHTQIHVYVHMYAQTRVSTYGQTHIHKNTYTYTHMYTQRDKHKDRSLWALRHIQPHTNVLTHIDSHMQAGTHEHKYPFHCLCILSWALKKMWFRHELCKLILFFFFESLPLMGLVISSVLKPAMSSWMHSLCLWPTSESFGPSLDLAHWGLGHTADLKGRSQSWDLRPEWL